jgi:Ran GTPase-activating protein (RanGAP) involved in mRNA processing and transport
MQMLLKTQARWNRLREVLNLTRCHSSLSHLMFSKNKFATAGINCLAAALGMSRSVQHVELAHCEISPACGVALGSMLADNRSIKTLILSWNRLGYGVAALAAGLADNRALDTLDLCWNGCGYEDTMAALSQALTSDTLALRTLLLAQNRIQPEHAVILAEGVQKSLSLRHLSLDGNPLGAMGRCWRVPHGFTHCRFV